MVRTGNAEDIVEEQYADLDADIAPWNISEMQVVLKAHWDLPCNWKVLAENFMESYHHAVAHVKTLQPIMPTRGTWTEGEKPNYVRCHLTYGDRARQEITDTESRGEQWDVFPTVEGLDDTGRHEWGLVMGYPFLTVVTAPDQVVWYRIDPVARDQLRLLTSILVPESTYRQDHPCLNRKRVALTTRTGPIGGRPLCNCLYVSISLQNQINFLGVWLQPSRVPSSES